MSLSPYEAPAPMSAQRLDLYPGSGLSTEFSPLLNDKGRDWVWCIRDLNNSNVVAVASIPNQGSQSDAAARVMLIGSNDKHHRAILNSMTAQFGTVKVLNAPHGNE